MPRAVSLHAFRDPTGAMGRVAFDLGNVYKVVGLVPPNSSALFVVLQWPLERVRLFRESAPPPALHRTLNAIDEAMHPLADARIARPDAGLIGQEYILTARLMRHACRRGLLAFESDPAQASALRRALDHDMQEFIHQYRHVWLSRNSPGGLTESVARLEKARQDYLAA